MLPRIWKSSDDGTIDFISLTPDYLEESVGLLKKSFFHLEYVSIAIGLPGNDAAISELDELVRRTAMDGVSIIAVEKKTNKVCGVAFNKIHVPNNPEDVVYFEDYIKNCKEPSSRSMLQFMDELVTRFDFFEYCNVDCILEIVFLATHPKFMRKGIARSLCETTIDLSKKLAIGENVKTPVNTQDLLLGPKPKLVTAIFTSPYSQKIGRALNWEIGSTVSYEEFYHKGRTFSSILGNEMNMTFEFKRI